MQNVFNFRFLSSLLCLISIGLAIICNGCGNGATTGKLTFALPTADWWTASPFIIQQSSGFFKQRSLEITTLEVNSGLASKNAVIAGTADIGLCASTPLALAAAKKEDLIILGTYLQSSGVVGLVRPRDLPSNSRAPDPIAFVPSTISESYLYQYLGKTGEQQLMERKQFPALSQKPADIPGALRSGSAKSAVIWEPFLSLAAEEPGFTVERNAVDFQVNLYLITRPSVYRSHKAEIDAFLKAVADSCQYLNENKDQARHQVERHFSFRTDFLASTFSTVNYGLTYDRSSMEAEIKREAEIAVKLGNISEIPNLDYMFVVNPQP